MSAAIVRADQICGASFLEALFPAACRDGSVDVMRMMQQCHYRAASILEFADGERDDSMAKRFTPDAIEAAKGYLAAATHLADYLPGGAFTPTLSKSRRSKIGSNSTPTIPNTPRAPSDSTDPSFPNVVGFIKGAGDGK